MVNIKCNLSVYILKAEAILAQCVLDFLKKLNSVGLENVRYKSSEMSDIFSFQTMDSINVYEE